MKIFYSITISFIAMHSLSAVDTDGDGMSDVWQRYYNIETGAGANDPDGDGRDNAAEALSGTNPHDERDFFKIESFVRDSTLGIFNISWRSLESRTYHISQSSDLELWQDNAVSVGVEGLLSSISLLDVLNDNFENRLPTTTDGTQTTGSNVDSSMEVGESLEPDVAGGNSVWWTWASDTSVEVTITTEGSDYDTTLAVYTGDSLETLMLVASNDDGDGLSNNASSVTFTAEAAVVYSFQVDGYAGETGAIVINHPVSSSTFSQSVIPEVTHQKMFYRVEADTTSDIDTDGDSLFAWEERLLGTDPYDGDSDGDEMGDYYEFRYELDPLSAADAAIDSDGDGFSNLLESLLDLNPQSNDSDNDGVLDIDEDFDQDGLTNIQEIQTYNTDPLQPDTDLDGLFDGWEVANGFSPTVNNTTDTDATNNASADPDNDGLTNAEEADLGTQAKNVDSDGDGVSDADEANQGSDPNDPNDSTPPPNGTVPVKITFGDPSGSHSEKYRITLIPIEGDTTGHAKRVRTNREYGETQTDTLRLPRGAKYTVEFTHAATDPEYDSSPHPDYDYDLELDTSQGFLVLDDPEDISGSHSEGSFFFAEGKSATLHVPLFEWVTPKSSPVSAPNDSGDGQNEFTYSSATTGVLTIDVKVLVKPTGTADLTGHDGIKFSDRCVFTLPTITGSSFTWDAISPGGKSEASGENVIAKATYTTLPSSNSEFGLKQAEFVCDNDTSILAKGDFEVFFSKNATNHSGTGAGTIPNWFNYWQEDNVCGIPSTALYDATADFGYTRPGVDSLLRLGPLAPATNTGPETYSGVASYGNVTVTGQGKGIDCVAETVAHELYHLTLYGIRGSSIDGDGDDIADVDEATLDGINSDITDPDTFNMGGGYSTYGDNEIRCRKKELSTGITVFPKLDWANPGSQSSNQFGPTP